MSSEGVSAENVDSGECDAEESTGKESTGKDFSGKQVSGRDFSGKEISGKDLFLVPPKGSDRCGKMSNSFLQKDYLGPPPGLGSVLVPRPKSTEKQNLGENSVFKITKPKGAKHYKGAKTPKSATKPGTTKTTQKSSGPQKKWKCCHLL